MSVQGRDVGPVSMTCEVLDRRRLGRYWGLTLSAPEIARRAAPGQFVNIAVSAPGTLLRRPFSIAGAALGGHVAGTIDVVLDPHGPGTDMLAGVPPGASLEVLGPLGRAFPLPQRRVSALLVGGGYGAAPMYYLGERLRAEGHRVNFLVGAADSSRIIDPIVPKRMATWSSFTTEDGSMGHRGRVTDLLAEDLETTAAEVVYACGPNAMLAAVGDICEAAGVPCQVAVEEHMACGVGVCMTCILPIHTRKGVQNRRVCVDGPVFTSTRIAWEESRYTETAHEPVDDDLDDRDASDHDGRGPDDSRADEGHFTAGVRTVRTGGRR
ncbi:dihydroorotate dehydrogenase electron transfer subunit [Salsipaludibacter albus]|uniref:dihydroorotate dehydrogenase electron transfer subunit n=1 Tax=Salsipaludibacter albus TaxID=2849650 RepID=UPI001EE3ED43|nr:dihydroorotate dehydrogenase electron transfer subunit [Salsipaludibacter albus]MBY5164034.1 dihydroorotate dehydrogenase electron transfer subunit [Salsipaludibacter albus]